MPQPASLSPPAWTALVVEDEVRLREGLVDHLRHADFPWRTILQAADAPQALELCQTQPPDVAFLDIHLPGASGLELASRLPAGTRLVFVTAYDAHAIAAFEAGAIDYLLKPVTPERLQKALDRLRERTPMALEALRAWLGSVAPPVCAEPLRWLTASSGRRTHWIAVEDVLFFQADSKYCRVECREGSFVISQPIKELAERLDRAMFQQVHRSTVVNLRAIAWLERLEGGGGLLHLRGREETLPVSAPFMKGLRESG